MLLIAVRSEGRFSDRKTKKQNWMVENMVLPWDIALEKLYPDYINSKTVSVSPLGDGHINDTFLADTGKSRYVVQRVKNTMDIESCLYNYGLYSKACEESDWYYPVWIPNAEGKMFFTDERGYHWRMYRYIAGDILNTPLDDSMLFSCGRGLAKMHAIFGSIKEKPKAVYPHLHDLKFYYDTYLKALRGCDGLTDDRDPTLEKIIDSQIEAMLNIGPDMPVVVHGDAKLANILFKDDAVIGFLDFDTIMMGSVLEDVADCIRSCCIEDGVLNKNKADMLVQGYNSAISKEQAVDAAKLPIVFDKICFELGLRYYTDAIAKEKVFKEKYNGYRLQRAHDLLGCGNKDR